MPANERADLRGKQAVDLSQTDKEIFLALPRGDLWIDSRVHEVFFYLCGSKNCQYLSRNSLNLYIREPVAGGFCNEPLKPTANKDS